MRKEVNYILTLTPFYNILEDMVNILKNLKRSKAREFNSATKIACFDDDREIPRSEWPNHWKEVDYKAYPRMDEIMLPDLYKSDWGLNEALLARKSNRQFTGKALGIDEFSNFLFFSGGMKKILIGDDNDSRFYPSAGARYPLEIYPFVFKVKTLEPAIYHYHVKNHSLELIFDEPFFDETMKQFNQSWIDKASALIVVSAVFDRTEEKYGDRGLRHIYTEYGHLSQNMSLIAAELGWGLCSVGGFIDDGLNRLIDLDVADESVIGVMALGTIK